MAQQIFTLVPRLNPSLGFVTAQEIWSMENTNSNNKKQRRNLDSGALRPRVIIVNGIDGLLCYTILTFFLWSVIFILSLKPEIFCAQSTTFPSLNREYRYTEVVIPGFCRIQFTVTFAGQMNVDRYTGVPGISPPRDLAPPPRVKSLGISPSPPGAKSLGINHSINSINLLSHCSDWVCTAVMSNDVMKDLRG